MKMIFLRASSGFRRNPRATCLLRPEEQWRLKLLRPAHLRPPRRTNTPEGVGLVRR